MDIKLEVGKKYVARNGEVIKIDYVAGKGVFSHPYKSRHDNRIGMPISFKEGGQYGRGDEVSDLDLVSDYTDPEK